jgi:hypothetical protein
VVAAATVAAVTARLAIVFIPVLALVVAGCGVRNSKPFTAKSTAPCLRDHGFTGVTTNASQVGFVAAFAENGGIKAVSPTGNTLTIAFTADTGSVDSTENAFRNHAPKAVRPHLSDIMEANRNAVLVWTITPKGDELDAVTRCLRS